MTRTASGFGLRIETLPDLRHIVLEVIPGGGAAATGRVVAGQELLAVNGKGVRGAPHTDVVQLLSAASSARIVVSDVPSIGDCRHVQLARDSAGSLGLRLQVARDENPLSYPAISHVADHNLHVVQPGDVIVRVNGQSVVGTTLEQVAPAFLADPLVLDIFRPPEGAASLMDSTDQATQQSQQSQQSQQQQEEEEEEEEEEDEQQQQPANDDSAKPEEEGPAKQQREIDFSAGLGDMGGLGDVGAAQGDTETVVVRRTPQGFGLQIVSPAGDDVCLHQVTLVLPFADIASGDLRTGDMIQKVCVSE